MASNSHPAAGTASTASAPPAASSNGSAAAPPAGAAVRRFGPYQLLRLVSKSERTSTWRVLRPGSDDELLLVAARQPLGTGAAKEMWLQDMRRVERLDHPRLAVPLEVGQQDSLPYALYDLRQLVPLSERLPSKGWAGAEAAGALVQVLQGLAVAHDTGVAHHDLQLSMLLVGEGGQVRLAGLGVAADMARSEGLARGGLQSHREAAERDVLAMGILLHHLLSGAAPLEEADCGRALARLPPVGRELLRLSYSTPHPVSDVLRAIANRCTDRQPRQRYRNARTLMQALEGWLATESGNGGTLTQLLDRVRAQGVVPASPLTAQKAKQLANMEDDHTSELAQVVLEDPALAFDVLRAVNQAQLRRHGPGHGDTVLSARRAIALLGLDAIRRTARSLKPAPNPGEDPAAQAVMAAQQRARLAGLLAIALRPAGYDPEAVYLMTLLQALGPLLLQYHFTDEAAQIQRLMQPAPAQKPGDPDEPGMTEEGAAFAVLGADLDTLGLTLARGWGLDDQVLASMRRLSPLMAVRAPESDHEVLRTVASCAHEVMDALAQPPGRTLPALQRVGSRYGRVLGFSPRELMVMVENLPRAAGEAPLWPAPAPKADAVNLRLVPRGEPNAVGAAGDGMVSQPVPLETPPAASAAAAAGGSRLRARAQLGR